MTAVATLVPINTRHNWIDGTERRIPACESPDGNDRTEKQCAACGMKKVTIHYPDGSLPGREWITASGMVWVGSATPPCMLNNPEVALQGRGDDD